MPVSYNKLWKILEERKMLKTDLIKAAGISTNAMAKLGRDEDVRIAILIKIYKTLDCKLVHAAKISNNALAKKERTRMSELKSS